MYGGRRGRSFCMGFEISLGRIYLFHKKTPMSIDMADWWFVQVRKHDAPAELEDDIVLDDPHVVANTLICCVYGHCLLSGYERFLCQ